MIRLHHLQIFNNEHLYGPGKRLLLVFQGCSLHCKGCINKHLWNFKGGRLYSNKEILIKMHNLQGITLYGGEPLDQAKGLYSLVKLLKQNNKNIVLFTGYIKKELNKIQKNIWDLSDIVISGRFEIDKINFNLQFRGSANQRIYKHQGVYKNYKINDKKCSTILSLDKNGQILINGFWTKQIGQLIDEIKK